MPYLKNYDKIKVKQKDMLCVPASVEWAIKYLKIDDIDLPSFYSFFPRKDEGYDFGQVQQIIDKHFPQIKFNWVVSNNPEIIQSLTEFLVTKDYPCLIHASEDIVKTRSGHCIPVIGVKLPGWAVFDCQTEIIYKLSPKEIGSFIALEVAWLEKEE